MTGRELIIYILENGLEDKKMFEKGKFLGFMNESEAAVKLDVGEATVRTWCEIGWLDHVKIENSYFIPINVKRPEL